MKKEVFIWIIFIVFLIPLVLADVFINEVEANPLGNDSGNEWIELFNNGNPINLTGWYIKDGDGFNHSLSPVIINDFYIADFLNWVDNVNENLSLYNNSNALQDSTNNLNDLNNNNRTNQKVPNGIGSFVFRDGTKGITNMRIINVPLNYATIQTAITNAQNGDIIEVAVGTYTEPIIDCDGDLAMFCIDKNITIRGDVGNLNPGPGVNAPLIDGNNIEASAFVLKRSASVLGMVIEGFEVKDFKNPACCTGGIGSGILAWNANTSKIKINDNYFHNLGWNGILAGSDDGSIQKEWIIRRNIIENSDYAGIELTNLDNSLIENNGVKIGSGIAWDPNDSGVGIEIAVRDHGTSVTTGKNIVRNNTITNDSNTGTSAGPRAGINILSRAYVSSADALLNKVNLTGNNITYINSSGILVTAESRNNGDAEVNNLLIKDNILNKNKEGIVIYDFNKSGSGDATHLNINIFNNLISNSFGIGSGIHINPATSADGILVNFNYLINNALFGINNEGTGILNAIFNYWGHCTGPSGNGTGLGDGVSANVNFEPWLGICIANKTETKCAFENNNASLFANIDGLELDTVLFSYTINGVNKNATGLKVSGTSNNYSYTINSSELVSGNVTWNVYANDSFGNWFMNGFRNFYIRNKTILSVTPSNPDGINGWYVTEPLFSLISDATKLRSYYRWDAVAEILFNLLFGLENIPNLPKESAGILELNYWSEFGCGNETIQTEIFQIDLIPPVINDLNPENYSIVFNNARPTIQALLDEIYGSNSGINKTSVYMQLDGNNVSVNVFDADSIDAIVRHNPIADLSEGLHNVSVYVEDKGGHSTKTTWFFEVNLSVSDFNLIVNSPKNGSFGSRRIPFNISTTKVVNTIEYINYNDRRPRWRILCRDCDDVGEKRAELVTLNEDFNNITIKAVDEFGNTKEENISLFIDSKEPKISKILPRRNSVINGSDFYVKFIEDNLEEVLVSWNPVNFLNISENCNPTRKNSIECFINLNLTDFDGEFIDYNFNVSDAIRSVESRKIRVKVDATSPILKVNMPENKTGVESYDGKVPFNLSVSEEVIIEFLDESDFNPRWRRLCSSCDEFGVSKNKTKSFKQGIHDIFIRAVDDAGNSDVKEVSFEVV